MQEFIYSNAVVYNDYYPYGMLLDGRHGQTTDSYRYGFQGQEMDDEVKGKGNSYTAEFWMYSPRVGRRWNPDPIVKHHESPYAAFANNPINFIDPSGADTLSVTAVNDKMKSLSQMSKDLSKEKKWIEERIKAHEKNVQRVKEIEVNHKLSKKAAKGNVNPLARKALEVLNDLNDIGVKALKVKLIEEATVINNRIEDYNKAVNYYETEKSLMEVELRAGEHLAIYYSEGILSIPKNRTEVMPSIQYNINNNSYKYGKTRDPGKRIYITLPKIGKMNTLDTFKLMNDLLKSNIKRTQQKTP